MDQVNNKENHPILSFILNPEKEPPENQHYDFFSSERNDDSGVEASFSRHDIYNLRDHPQSLSDNSEKDEVILSIIWQKGQMGAAYYSLDKSQISFVGDVHDWKPDFVVSRNLFEQCHPRYVLTLQKVTEPFINVLKELTGNNSDILRILPSKDYQWQICEKRARDIRLPSMPMEASEEEYRLYLLSSIDWNCSVAIHALGLLLRYLDRFYSELAMCAHGTPPPILALEAIHLNSLVHMDLDTIAALQIFCGVGGEQLGSNIGSIPMSKQGLSLLGILNRTRSRLGSQRLRSILKQPTNDKNILESRYDLIQWACEPNNKEVVDSVHKCLRHIRDPTMVITRLGGGRPMPRDWWALHRTLYHSLLVCAYLEPHKDCAPLLKKIVSARHKKLDHALYCLTRILDFDDSTENTMNIQSGIVPKLDSLRIQREKLPNMLTKVAEQELLKLPTRFQHCSVHYLPEMGFLLTLPLNENLKFNNSTNILESEMECFEHMFNAGNLAYYKSQRMRQLDTQLGDTQRQIWCFEAAIMLRLVEFIQILTPILMCLVRPLAELDALLGMGLISNERGYIRPKLHDETSIIVKGARHPLQELCVESFIPNDINLTKDDYRILLLTGANAAGKSVYLKQVGLIAFMAHIGCFVPAESALIGLTDAIYSRIHSIETTSRQLSAFMLDLKQVSLAVRGATRKSIVLLDEFGKGTNEVDGMSLLVATVEHWANRGPDNCCHLIISTHLLTAARIIMQNNHPHLKAQYFEHITDHDGQIVYLYRLVPGIAKTSQALLTAANVGVPEALISRAREILDSFDPKKNETLKPLCVLSNRQKNMVEFGRQFLLKKLENDKDVTNLKERLSLILNSNIELKQKQLPPIGKFSPEKNACENHLELNEQDKIPNSNPDSLNVGNYSVSIASSVELSPLEDNKSNLLSPEKFTPFKTTFTPESHPFNIESPNVNMTSTSSSVLSTPLEYNKRHFLTPAKFSPFKTTYTLESETFETKSPNENMNNNESSQKMDILTIDKVNDKLPNQISSNIIQSSHGNLFLQDFSSDLLDNSLKSYIIEENEKMNYQKSPKSRHENLFLQNINSKLLNTPPVLEGTHKSIISNLENSSNISQVEEINNQIPYQKSPKSRHENLFLQNISSKLLNTPPVLEGTHKSSISNLENSSNISQVEEINNQIPYQKSPKSRHENLFLQDISSKLLNTPSVLEGTHKSIISNLENSSNISQDEEINNQIPYQKSPKSRHENLFLQDISSKSSIFAYKSLSTILENSNNSKQSLITPKSLFSSDNTNEIIQSKFSSHLSSSLTPSSVSNCESEFISNIKEKNQSENKNSLFSSELNNIGLKKINKKISQNLNEKRKPAWEPFLTSPPSPKRSTPLKDHHFFKSRMNFSKTF